MGGFFLIWPTGRAKTYTEVWLSLPSLLFSSIVRHCFFSCAFCMVTYTFYPSSLVMNCKFLGNTRTGLTAEDGRWDSRFSQNAELQIQSFNLVQNLSFYLMSSSQTSQDCTLDYYTFTIKCAFLFLDFCWCHSRLMQDGAQPHSGLFSVFCGLIHRRWSR